MTSLTWLFRTVRIIDTYHIFLLRNVHAVRPYEYVQPKGFHYKRVRLLLQSTM